MYFSNFPLIPYTLDEGKTWQYLRDITIRTRILEENFNQVSMYNYFIVNDGATPEDIATEVYGTPYLHWVVLLCNDIIDPVMEWPFSEERLRDHVWKTYRTQILTLSDLTGFIGATHVIRQNDDIYGTVKYVQHGRYYTTGKKFYIEKDDEIPTLITSLQTEAVATISNIEWNTMDEAMNEIHHIVDEDGIIKQTRYDGINLITLPSDRVVTNYDYENEKNEKHREIKLLRKEYLRQFIQEFKRLINE